MYTATCSSCSHSEKTPFARVGAVMVCPACKAKVQLRVEDVKRQFKLRIDAEDELFRVPQVQHAPEDAAVGAAAALAVALEAAPPSQALPEPEIHEDHSELALEAERRADAVKRRKPKSQAIVKPGLSSGELAQHLAQKRKMKSLAIFGGLGLAAIIGIVIALSSGPSTRAKDGDPAKDSSVVADPSKDGGKDGGRPAPSTDGEKDKAIASKDGATTPAVDPNKDKAVIVPPQVKVVRVAALPLGIDTWQPVNEAYRVAAVNNRVVLINDSSEKQDNGGRLFKAEVVSQGVTSALVTVALVNDEDRIYARFERPFYLLDGKNSRPLLLSIPPELVGGATSICWAAAPVDTHVTNPTLLQDTLAEVLKSEASPILKISAYNSSSFQLQEAAFVIQGIDAAGQVASQWRLKFPGQIDARSWVKFEADLAPADVKQFTGWRVLGAGLPVGGEVAPPVVIPDPDPKERDPKDVIPPRRGKGLFDF